MHTVIRSIVRITIAAICATLLLVPVGRSARVASLDQLTRRVVDTEAAKYRRAVNDLGSIESMSLKTEADFKKASAIVNDQVENLRFVKYRMVQIALSNSVFATALESEFVKSKGDEDAVLQRFRQNPASLTGLSGGRAAQQGIAAELKRDFQRIRSAGEHLRESASTILNRRGSLPQSVIEQPSYISAGYSAPATDDSFEALFAASTIMAGVVRGRSMLPVRPGSSGSSGGSSSSSSSVWVQDQQEYQDCARQAGTQQDRCKANCGPGLFQWACLGSCIATYMLTKAECEINSLHSN